MEHIHSSDGIDQTIQTPNSYKYKKGWKPKFEETPLKS